MGSAVDSNNLTRQLEMFKQAGLGGVEICPIYGAHGYEDRFTQFLSPQWMDMFAHTTSEAQRPGLGVDLTTGTGWPFGGPRVPVDETSGRLVEQVSTSPAFNAASAVPRTRAGHTQPCKRLRAFGEDNTQLDLTEEVRQRPTRLDRAAGNMAALRRVWEVRPGAEGQARRARRRRLCA